jgi:uncharacterized integral membrane protein
MSSNDHPHDFAAGPVRKHLSPMIIGWVVLAAAGLIFVIQNRDTAKIDFLFFHRHARQWVNILVAIAIGIGLDRLFTVWWRRRQHNAAVNNANTSGK